MRRAVCGQTSTVAGDCTAHTVDEVSNGQVREDKQDKQAPRTSFTRFQRQQLARLRRADRLIQRQAYRSIERGDPLYRIYRRLRRGLIEALRAALFSAGDKSAGGYGWLALIERAGSLLPASAAELEALTIVAAMPFLPEEPEWQGSPEELVRYLAACKSHQSAAWKIQKLAGQVAGQCIGIRDGRWLRLASGQTCKLLRWNGVAALLGDVGAQNLIDYFDVLEAIALDRLTWIDDVNEIERLEARLVSTVPVNVDDGDDFEETEQKDNFTLDPIRSAMVVLQATEIAGLSYHRARDVAARLVCGMRLQLVREPDNAHDFEAVAIAMETGEKLGYVPRRCNAGIARRLDEGVALGVWLVHIEWDRNGEPGEKPWHISVEIRSPDPSDVSATEIPARAEAKASTLASQRAARSYWRVRFAFGSIEKARAALGRNDLGEMLGCVDTAYKWAQEAWLFQHDLTPNTGNGWRNIGPQFNQVTRDTGLGGDFALLEHELVLRSSIPRSTTRDTALALCLLRIESLWHQHLVEVEASAISGGGGVSMTIGLPPPPPLRPPPEIPLARRYLPLRRIQALRPLRRLLRVIQRVECLLPASTADLRCLRLFNRDRALVHATLRQLAHALRESLRDLLQPAKDGTCWEPDENHARLFPHLIPNAAKWHLVNEAATLLEQEEPDLTDLRALRAQLSLLQPETHRFGRVRRRRAKDREIFVAEQLLLCAETHDMLDLVNGTCLLMPMDRRNRLLRWALWQLFDALCAELFGKHRVEMLRDYPVLLAVEAPPLDFAITAWQREIADAPDLGILSPAESAARTLLLEALVGHSGRWPDDLVNHIPAIERLFPL